MCFPMLAPGPAFRHIIAEGDDELVILDPDDTAFAVTEDDPVAVLLDS